MQNVNLNLIPGSVLPVVNVSQYDVGRHFTLTVYEGATAYSLTGKGVQIRGTKPDGNGFAYDSTDGAISVSNNVVTVSTLQQMTACGGQVMCELRITSGSDVLGTINFILDCEPSALSDDTPISDTDIPVIERDFEAALAEAEADALIAEGYAKGTQDGVPATSGEPYYQDNAKYYKEQAEAAASGGGADALKAEGYAVGTQNGTPVSSGSPYYHNNAKYYEGEAATSASNASTSETNAGNSATAAGTDALKSEGFAVGEQNGVPVSSGSPYYQNNAKYYNQTANPTVLANMSDVDIDNPQNHQVLQYNSTSQKWENANGGNVSDLSDLDDVTISTPTDGQALIYDSNSGEWVNGTVSTVGSIDDLSDVDITSASNGDLLQYNSTSQEWENSAAIPNALGAVRDNGAVNLYNNTATTQTKDGVTYTIASNGTVALSGIASADTELVLQDPADGWHLPADNYQVSGGVSNAVSLVFYRSGGTVLATSTGGNAVLSSKVFASNNLGLKIVIANGTDTTGMTVSPMVFDKRFPINTPYQPYAMTNGELTEEVLDFASIFADLVTSGTTFTVDTPISNLNNMRAYVLGDGATHPIWTGYYKYAFVLKTSNNRGCMIAFKGAGVNNPDVSSDTFAYRIAYNDVWSNWCTLSGTNIS